MCFVSQKYQKNQRKIRMEVLRVFPVLEELMNHTCSIFERHLSGLFLKISNNVGATSSPSNLVRSSAILTADACR